MRLRYRFWFERFEVRALAVALLLVLGHWLGVTRPIESGIRWMVRPVQAGFYYVSTRLDSFFRATADTQVDCSPLENQVRQLTLANATLTNTLEAAEKANEQYSFAHQQKFETVVVRVLGKNNQPDQRVLYLDRGSRDGVAIDQPVIVDDGTIIGKISRVDATMSAVTLLDDSTSQIAVTIQNQDRTRGLVVGDRGLSLKMELIPQDDHVAVHDVIITSGLETMIPRGLFVGRVEQIITAPNSFFQTAFITPLIDFDDTVVASIIINHPILQP